MYQTMNPPQAEAAIVANYLVVAKSAKGAEKGIPLRYKTKAVGEKRD